MIARTLPPVCSPLTLTAIGRGIGGLLGQAGASTRLRSMLLQQYRSRDLLLTDSGTTALSLALRLAVGRRRDTPRIALPAWGCYDLATAADGAEVEVVLYDLDPRTLGPDRASLDRALGTGVAAVVVVHFFGLPVNLTEIPGAAAAAGALVIEDAAQAIGTELNQRPAGAVGELGVLSFGRGKGWTGGGGGALLLGGEAPAELDLSALSTLAAPGSSLAMLAKSSAQWLLARPAWYALPAALPFLRLGETIYHRPHPPGGLSSAQAAMLLETARWQDSEAEGRRTRAARLSRAIERAVAGSVPTGWEGGRPGLLRLPFLPNQRVLSQCATGEARRLGIMPGYPIPLSRLNGFAGRLYRSEPSYPGAEELAGRLYTLPTHGLLTQSDLQRLEGWIAQAGR